MPAPATPVATKSRTRLRGMLELVIVPTVDVQVA
jgi:hypothetical protein